MKRIICKFKGHVLEAESITKQIGGKCWCKRCTRCGRYVLHGEIGAVTITEKEALEFKKEFEDELAFYFNRPTEKGGGGDE